MNARSNQQTFESFMPKLQYSYNIDQSKHKHLSNMQNRATKKICHKISLKTGYRFDHDNWHVNNTEIIFLPTDIESSREPARIGFVNKYHHAPKVTRFDLLNDPCWQAILEAKRNT